MAAVKLPDLPELPVITHCGERVMTTELLARAYGVEPKVIHDGYLRSKGRFEAGKHFHELTRGELRAFKNDPAFSGLVGANASKLVLWTERGAARHAKTVSTDEAWAVFEKLEDAYFRAAGRSAVAVPALAAPDWSNPNVLIALLTEQTQGRIADQQRVAEAEAATFVLQTQMDRLRAVKGSLSLRDAGKTLGLKSCDQIFEELHSRKWIYRRNGKGEWIAHAGPYASRYLDHRTVTFKGKGGDDEMKSQVVVTPKGLLKIAELLALPLAQENPV